MTSVNVTTTKNTVTVNGETRVVTVKTQGPQGPAFADGDIGDIVISGGGTVATIDNGAVNNAKIASDAAIALSKLATGALPTAITVTSANISDLSIVDADISGSAAISLSKLATGALPTAITVTSANISDLSIVNADINASAAIAGTKISPDFGSQNIVTTGTGATGALGVTGNITVSGTVDGRDVATDGTKLDGIETGATADQTASEIKTAYESNSDTNAFTDALLSKLNGIESNATADQTKADIDALGIAASTAATLLNARTIAGTSFDGSANIDISYTNLTNKLSVGDGGLTQNNFTNALKTKLDGIETGATADQTASEILTLLSNQNILTSGTLKTTGNAVIIEGADPKILLTDTNHDSDFRILNENGVFKVFDQTNSANRFQIASGGTAQIFGNLDIGAGCDVTGNITVTGTVDGVDIATRDTLFGGLTSSSGVLTNGVTATTQSASDNSTKVATTAYTDTAIANLVDSAPGTLNTLNELAAALGDDANFSTTITNSIATKLPLAGGTLTGNLTISNTQPTLFLTDTDNNDDFSIRNTNGVFTIRDATNGTDRLQIDSVGNTILNNGGSATTLGVAATFRVTNGGSSGAYSTFEAESSQGSIRLANNGVFIVTGNINVTGTVDGRDVAADGTKLDGIESNATADQTASEIVALVADQTIAPSIIDMEDNEEIRLGNSDDLVIEHDGSHSRIKDTGTGNLNIQSSKTAIQNAAGTENCAIFTQDGSVELYYDFSKKLETTSSGITVSGSNTTGSRINGSLVLATDDGTTNLQLFGSSGVLRFYDNKKATFGTGDDLQIYHDASNSILINATGALLLQSNDLKLGNYNLTDVYFRGQADNAAELYFDNSKKLETTSTGAKISGTLLDINTTSANSAIVKLQTNVNSCEIEARVVGGENHLILSSNNSVDSLKITGAANGTVQLPNDNQKLQIGASQDLEIYHNGSHSIIQETGTGDLELCSNTRIMLQKDRTEALAKFIPDGAVELYYDNSKKLETDSTGVTVTGILRADEIRMGDSGGATSPNERIRLGNSEDLQIWHDGSDSIIKNDTGDLYIQNDGNNTTNKVLIRGKAGESSINVNPDGAVELYYDNSKKFETTSTGVKITGSNTTGTEALGDFRFENAAGTQMVIFEAEQSKMRHLDGIKATFGTGDDLQIFHDGTNSFINNFTGNLELRPKSGEAGVLMVPNGSTELYYDGTKKLETRSGDVRIYDDLKLGDDLKIKLGTADDLHIYHDGSHTYIENNTGTLYLRAKVGENSVTAFPDGTVKLAYDDSTKLETFSGGISVTGNIAVSGTVDGVDVAALSASVSGFLSNIVEDTSPQLGGTLDTNGNNIEFGDGEIAKFGDSQDLQIYHNGNHSRILDSGTGKLQLGSDTEVEILNGSFNESMAKFQPNGAVELYYDNSKKLDTQSGGVRIFGYLSMQGSSGSIFIPDTAKLEFGNSQDLKIYHDASNSYIQDVGTGQLRFLSNDYVFYNAGGNENIARFIENGAVELYYDNSKKLETTAIGVTISGDLKIPDGEELRLGDGNDIQIYHASNHSTIENSTGEFRIKNTSGSDMILNSTGRVQLQVANGEKAVYCDNNGAVELYHNNVKKFETTSTGANVTSANDAVLKVTTTGTASTDDARIELITQESTFTIQNDRSLGTDGVLTISPGSEGGINIFKDGVVQIYNDGSKKFETSSTGVTVTGQIISDGLQMGDSDIAKFGSHDDLQIYHDGSHSYIDESSGTGRLKVRTGGMDITSEAGAETIATFNMNGSVELYYDDSKKLETNSTGIHIFGNTGHADGAADLYGSGNDLSIFHDGTNSKIVDSGTGSLIIQTSNFNLDNADGTENILTATENGAVELYHNGTKKLQTDSAGTVFLDDTFLGDNLKANFGASADLQIYHDGTNSLIKNQTNSLYLLSADTRITNAGVTEHMAKFFENGAVELFYDNSKKFETTSSGVTVTGTINFGSGMGSGLNSNGFNINFADSNGSQDMAKFGTGGDLRIYHDGSNSFIQNLTGGLRLLNHVLDVRNDTGNETILVGNANGSVDLYHNNIKKFETSSEGVKFTLSGNATNRFDQTSASNNKFQNLTYSRSGNSRGDCSVVAIGEGTSSQGHIKIRTSAGNAALSGGVELINGNTAFSGISDIRLKNKISDITDALINIDKIEPIKYSWKYDKENTPHIGVSAQSVNEVYPEVIELTRSSTDESDETDYLSVLHTELIPVCIAAIKELKAKVEILETKVATLEGA